MKQQIWSESYKIASYLVNLRGRAGLYAILNLIQDVGWVHAMHLQVKLAPHHGWVFTRQKLVMNEWPTWNETITIKTWLRPPSDVFLMRDYEIFLGDRKIGECTSTFTVMDMNTRKLAVQDWSAFAELWRADGHLPHQPGKIVFSSEAEELAQFQVRNSDLDMNNHVNNTKYALWVLDVIPLDVLRAGVELREYEVNFMAETKSGDVVAVQKSSENKIDEAISLIQFQGVRAADKKPVFTALMKVQA